VLLHGLGDLKMTDKIWVEGVRELKMLGGKLIGITVLALNWSLGDITDEHTKLKVPDKMFSLPARIACAYFFREHAFALE